MKRHTKVYLALLIALVVIVVIGIIIGINVSKKTSSSLVNEDIVNLVFNDKCMDINYGITASTFIGLTPCEKKTTWIIEKDQNETFRLKREIFDKETRILIYLSEYYDSIRDFHGYYLSENRSNALVFKFVDTPNGTLLKIVSGTTNYYVDTVAVFIKNEDNSSVLNFTTGNENYAYVKVVPSQDMNQVILKKLESLDEMNGKELLLLSKIENSDYYMSMVPNFTNNTYLFCCTCSSELGTCDNCYNEVLPVSYHYSELYDDITLTKPNSDRPIKIPDQRNDNRYYFKKWFIVKEYDSFYLKMKYKCSAFGKGIFDNIYFMKTDGSKPFVDLEHKSKSAYQTFKLKPTNTGFYIETFKDGEKILCFKDDQIQFLPTSEIKYGVVWNFYENSTTQDCSDPTINCSCGPIYTGNCNFNTIKIENCESSRKLRACQKNLSSPFTLCFNRNDSNYCLTDKLIFQQDKPPSEFVVANNQIQLATNKENCLSVQDNKLNIQPCNSNNNSVQIVRNLDGSVSLVNNDKCARFFGFGTGLPFGKCDQDTKFITN